MNKIYEWIFEGVIVKKVLGKFVKHFIGVLVAIIAANPMVKEAGVIIDWAQFEVWLVATLGGLFGAAFNYIQHRFIKKDEIKAV